MKYEKGMVWVLLSYYRTFYRPRIHYMEGAVNPKEAPAAIYIANHTSLNDAMFLVGSMRNEATILVARDWYEKKKFQWIMKQYECIACDRYGLDTAWLREAMATIKAGRSILIFPEGKTRKDGELNEFKSGFAMLAAMTGAPIICIGASGDYKFMHKTWFVIDKEMKLDRSKGINTEYFKEVCDQLQARVKELKTIAIEKQANKKNK